MMCISFPKDKVNRIILPINIDIIKLIRLQTMLKLFISNIKL